MDILEKKVLSRMQRICSKCECCSFDIYNKAVAALVKALGAESCTDDIRDRAGEILSSLREEGYVDDARYAAAFAREKSALSGWGPVKIRFALKQKHIDGDEIENALSDVDSARSGEKLRRLLEARWKNLTGPDGSVPDDARLKLIRYALSRGYEYEEIKCAVESVVRNG